MRLASSWKKLNETRQNFRSQNFLVYFYMRRMCNTLWNFIVFYRRTLKLWQNIVILVITYNWLFILYTCACILNTLDWTSMNPEIPIPYRCAIVIKLVRPGLYLWSRRRNRRLLCYEQLISMRWLIFSKYWFF